MASYFILMDYVVPILYKKDGLIFSSDSSVQIGKPSSNKKIGKFVLPRNYLLFRISSKLEVKVVFYKGRIGRLLIKSNSRREAYSLANAIRGIIGIFYGYMPDSDPYRYFLEELHKIPNASWKESDFVNSLAGVEIRDSAYLGLKLEDGWVLFSHISEEMAGFVKTIYKDSDLLDAMNHLLESNFLFEGTMASSYYHCHYHHDRKEMPKWKLEKSYFEKRLRYELAFLAAFKGIERYFKVNGFRKSEIPSLFGRITYKNVSFSTVYTRYHEIFSGCSKKVRYGELLAHFLLMRNVVAAHGNRKPPKTFLISADNIFEIQLFLRELISKAIISMRNIGAN